jgi:serine/threonine-protein kinase
VTSELRDHLQNSLGNAYRLDREFGGGGMSRVFLAEDRTLQRSVVVKLLSPELAARLQHSYIVPLLQAEQAAADPRLEIDDASSASRTRGGAASSFMRYFRSP